MARGARFTETLFQRGLWLIAFLFAWFLIGLGGRIVNDLPKVESQITLDDFVDKAKREDFETKVKELKTSMDTLRANRDLTALRRDAASKEYKSAYDSFQNWIATRFVTKNPGQDPVVEEKTHQLDELKKAEQSIARDLEAFDMKILQTEQAITANDKEIETIKEQGRAAYDKAIRTMELRVFLYRLAFTLPLILISLWLFVRKRKNMYWPFVWGFIFFSLFAFFVELLPYLPSYGGYVRYTAGIILTFIVGLYAIKSLQRYLERIKSEEAAPDKHRRENLPYEVVLVRLSKKICPGCEREIDLTAPEINHCPHCGITIFNRCQSCNIKKNAFAPFCFACGTASILG